MTATKEQIAALGAASRRLLDHAWSRTPRLDILVTNGLIAVGKTFSSDKQASADLLRRVIEPEHLKEFGYRELTWLTRQIRTIADADPGFAVDIYRAAYSFSESSDEATAMGNSALLAMRSNRRQDYQGSWFQLSESLTPILEHDLQIGLQALTVSLEGYGVRERNREPYPGETGEGRFTVGTQLAHFAADWSHTWYRGGFKPMQDAPVLLTKFEAFLFQLDQSTNATAEMSRIVTTLAGLPFVPAAVWASLLLAGARSPQLYAEVLAPLAVAEPIIRSSDTRYQLGEFIRAAYPVWSNTAKQDFEHTILALTGDRADRYRAVLAGCIPEQMAATGEMTAYLAELSASGAERANAPPMQFTSSVRPYDTDAYLERHGVNVEAGDSKVLRDQMRQIEALNAQGRGTALSLADVKAQIGILYPIARDMHRKYPGKVPDTLLDHAYGDLSAAVARLTHAAPAILQNTLVRPRLKEMLLLCAASANPHYHAEHAKNFHENLSWGGPSARTLAAEGLMAFVRGDKRKDAKLMTAIRTLARDKMPEVRMQIVGNAAMLRNLDPVWAWSEVEYALKKDPTRGLVESALGALSRLARDDIPRTIRAAKGVLKRYHGKSGAGMAACRQTATELIFDLHIYFRNEEADQFAAALIGDTVSNADVLSRLVARYSDTLLVGNVSDPAAEDNEPRERTITFYAQVVERAFAEVETRAAALDINKFNTWPEADQEISREMFRLLDEVSLRLHFAAGTHHDNLGPSDDEVTPARARLYAESKAILERLAGAVLAPIAHHLIQFLEVFIPLDPAGVFSLIAKAVKSAEIGGYSNEQMAVDLIVRIVKRYLADYRAVFSDRNRLEELMDCLDSFVRAGWPSAQELVFQLDEIWR